MKYFILLTGLLLIGCGGGQDTQFTSLSELEEPPFQEALESRLELETAETRIGRKKALTTEPGQVGENAFKQDEEGTGTAETKVTDTTVTDEEWDIYVDVTVEARRSGTTSTTTTATAEAEATAEAGTQQVEAQVSDDSDCTVVESKGTGASEATGGKIKIYQEKVDIHFYIDNPYKAYCSDKFVRNTYRKGFLEHLGHLDWWFSHSVFSPGENRPGRLEMDGRLVSAIHRARKRRSSSKTVMTKHFQYIEDIFAYTVAPFTSSGSSFYVNHSTAAGDNTIWHDAPEYDHKIHKNGKEDPLAGLDDILTNKYGVIRKGSRVEVFVVADKFPNYSEEDVKDFLNAHKNLRVHALYKSSQNKIGSLADIVEKTGGSINKLCGGNKNIGPDLAEAIAQKPVSEEPPKKKCGK